MAAAARRTTEQFLQSLDDYIEAPPAERAEAPAVAAPRRAAATDVKVVVASALGGFALALVAVAVGRWTARR
jgi:hypothetical protein